MKEYTVEATEELRKENYALKIQLSNYAYQMDKARLERDKAELENERLKESNKELVELLKWSYEVYVSNGINISPYNGKNKIKLILANAAECNVNK